MAYTVAASFDKFRQNIELTSDHRETATRRANSIVSLLDGDFDILDAFPSGSIPRYTAVRGYADLDVIGRGRDRLESYQRSALLKNQLARCAEIALLGASVSTDLRTPPARIRFKEFRQS